MLLVLKSVKSSLYFTRRLITRSISNQSTDQSTNQSPKKSNETLLLFLKSASESHPFYPTNQYDYASEKDIVRNFLKLADVSNPLRISHNFQQWKELKHYSQRLYRLPESPKPLSSFTLPRYINELSNVKTRGRRDLLNSVSDIYLSIMKSGLLLDIGSHTTILNFFARTHKFNEIKFILNTMIKRNIDPNIKSFNVLLFPLIGSMNKDRNALCANYLHHMEVFQIRPDLTTWYIMLSFLGSEKLTIFNEMKGLKLPLRPVTEEVITIKWNQENITSGELYDYLEEKRVAIDEKILFTIIGLHLQRDDIDSALEYLESVFPRTISFIPPNIVLCFVAYFCGRGELYNGIALINYFREHYSLKFKPFKAYEILAEALTSVPNSPYWSMIARRFYLDSMIDLTNTAMSYNTISKVNKCADEYGYSSFKLNEIYVNEANEVRDIFEKLRWPGKPVLTLKDNTKGFIDAAEFLGGVPKVVV